VLKLIEENIFKDLHSTFLLRKRELQFSNIRRTPKAQRDSQVQLKKVNNNNNDQHGQRSTNQRKHSTTDNA
jgi:hypothetical protein